MRTSLGLLFLLLTLSAAVGIAAVGSAYPNAINEFDREPEDLVLLTCWMTALLTAGTMWSIGASYAFRGPPPQATIRDQVLPTAAAVFGGLLILGGVLDPFDTVILVLFGVVLIASALAYRWLSKPRRHAA